MNKTKRTEAEQVGLLAHILEKYEYLPSGQVRHKGHERPLKPRKTNAKYYDIQIRFQGKKHHLSIHVVIWVLCKCRWPTMPLDHLNGNTSDNRIENLRECTQSENKLNMLLPWKPNPITGIPGVSKENRRYRCRIRGIKYRFNNPYEAFLYAIQCGKRYR